MIRLREGDDESILTIDEFERRARRGEISPFAEVCLPAMTGDRFVQARELSLFTAIYDPRRILFRRHFHLGRFPIVTGALAIACVAVYFVTQHLGEGVVTREALLELGAKARARIVDEGQLWRVLTANVLHRDATHLAFNLFALLNIGTVLEGVYRRGDYVLLCVVGGVTTMALSTFASGPVTVGASGLIFACLGCAVVFGLRFSEVLPVRYRLYFGVVVVGYAAVMFYLGLQRASTDNWGHAGGLMSGLVMGAILEPRLMRLREAREPLSSLVRPWLASLGVIVLVVALGPAVPRLAFKYKPYLLDAFGIEIERPSTWSKGPDPLGFLAFGNGVDALASVACARVSSRGNVEEAARRFVDRELKSLARAGHIGDLEVGEPTVDVIGRTATGPGEGGAIPNGDDPLFRAPSAATLTVPARRVPFSFLASDGPFQADAWVFVRGEMECAFVLAHRSTASARSKEILDEVRQRLRLVQTKAQRDAMNAAVNRPHEVKAQLDLALANQAAGDVDNARAAFVEAERLLVSDAGYQGRVRVGRARFELEWGGDLDAALLAAEQARISSADDPDAAVLLLDVLLARGDVERVKIASEAALKQWADEPRLLERRARALGETAAPGAPEQDAHP